MSNSFDFELVASDQVSEAIDRINEAVRDLEPKLDKTKEGLKLGGQETADGLSGFISRLENMSKSARDNVQFIGDMVPPLKMVGELTGKMGALGLAGAAGYGLKQVAYGFREASVRPIILMSRQKMRECALTILPDFPGQCVFLGQTARALMHQ